MNNDEPQDFYANHGHFYIAPGLFPNPNCSDTEWIQRVTMLGGVAEAVAGTLFQTLGLLAPVMLGDPRIAHLITGLGVLGQGINRTGTEWLAKRNLVPLDAQEEQLRVIRDELADPRTPPEVREALLTILQYNLDRMARPQPVETVENAEETDEWPSDVVIDDSDV